jgi:hypothetical protein
VKIRLLLPADEEFAQAALFYYEESPQTARKFKGVVEESLRAIAANPKRYRCYSRNIRVKVVKNFPYSIFIPSTRKKSSLLRLHMTLKSRDIGKIDYRL